MTEEALVVAEAEEIPFILQSTLSARSILEQYNIPLEMWDVLKLMSNPTTRAQIESILARVNVLAIQQEIIDAQNAILGATPVVCGGGCGRTFAAADLMHISIPGYAFARVCPNCHARLIAKEERKLTHRSIKSALSRARAAKLPATLTNEEWQKTLKHFKNSCAYCGKTWYVVEHVTSIELGGGTTADNCVPSCYSCNVWKGSRTLEDMLKIVAGDRYDRCIKIQEWLSHK